MIIFNLEKNIIFEQYGTMTGRSVKSNLVSQNLYLDPLGFNTMVFVT